VNQTCQPDTDQISIAGLALISSEGKAVWFAPLADGAVFECCAGDISGIEFEAHVEMVTDEVHVLHSESLSWAMTRSDIFWLSIFIVGVFALLGLMAAAWPELP
jgi:hypothetical protein